MSIESALVDVLLVLNVVDKVMLLLDRSAKRKRSRATVKALRRKALLFKATMTALAISSMVLLVVLFRSPDALDKRSLFFILFASFSLFHSYLMWLLWPIMGAVREMLGRE